MPSSKLSALTELAAVPADDDEEYIRDTSEAAADESKRITVSNRSKHYDAFTATLTNKTFDANGAGNSITNIENADIAASAAIAFSKLAVLTDGNILVGNASNLVTSVNPSGDVDISNAGVFSIAAAVIVDADIATAAEIAVSKLADGAARQLLQTDAAGTGVEWASNIDIPGTLDVTGIVTLDSTLDVAALSTLAAAGVALITQNTTDAVSNQVAIFRAGNRATPADNDEGYVSFTLDDNNGAQQEFARQSFQATDVTSTTKDGRMTFSVIRNNILVNVLELFANRIVINQDAANTDLRIESQGNNNMFNIDAALNVVSIGGAAVSGQALTVYGLQAPDGDGTRDLGVQTTAQYANVWSDLINGAEISLENRWRMLESELYPGYPEGWALGHNERWRSGKSIWAGKERIGNEAPVFVVTEEFIEFRGRRITPLLLDKLIEKANA